MKRIQKFSAVNIIVALLGTGIPALAAQNGHDSFNRGGEQYVSADHRGDRNGNFRIDDHNDRDRRDAGRGYGYAYAPAPVYEPAPVYMNRDYDERSYNGRAAAIIGGSAAAGALIGAAAGHGEGAVIGAVIGGIAGTAANAAVDHHDRY